MQLNNYSLFQNSECSGSVRFLAFKGPCLFLFFIGLTSFPFLFKHAYTTDHCVVPWPTLIAVKQLKLLHCLNIFMYYNNFNNLACISPFNRPFDC